MHTHTLYSVCILWNKYDIWGTYVIYRNVYMTYVYRIKIKESKAIKLKEKEGLMGGYERRKGSRN